MAPAPHPSPKPLLMRSKDLDLFVLAGCSCLLTLLYHPVLDQIQNQPSPQSHRGVASGSANAANPATTSPKISAFPGVMPTERFRLEDEDETA